MVDDVHNEVTLAALGDIILSRAPHDPGNAIFGVVAAADVSIGNLEFTLTGNRPAQEKLIALRADPDLAKTIASWGVDILSLANNHAFDFGNEGLFDSIAAVKDAGMAAVGAGKTLDESLRPHIRTVNGKRIAFFAVSTHLPGGSAAAATRPGIAPVRVRSSYAVDAITLRETPGMSPYVQTEVVREDLDRLCDAIGKSGETVDLVILHIHWGIPLGWTAFHQNEIADYQRPLAKAVIDAGCSAVIGHGPHVIQAVEFYKESPILYSIGNFIMHDILPETGSAGAYPSYEWDSLRTHWNSIGCVARLTWDGHNRLPDCELLVTKLDPKGESQIATRAVADDLLARLAVASRKFRTDLSIRESGPGWGLVFRPSDR